MAHPTGFPLYKDLPPELRDTMIRNLSGGTQRELSRSDRESRKNVHGRYTDEYRERPDLIAAFQASQDVQERDLKRARRAEPSSQPETGSSPAPRRPRRAVSNVGPSDSPLLQRIERQRESMNGAVRHPIPEFNQRRALQQRADSLVRKTENLFGGRSFVYRATEFDQISSRHPDVLDQMAKARWNSKLIGIYPFLKAIEGGEDFLRALDPRRSDRENFLIITRWIEDHPRRTQDVVAVSICGFTRENVPEFRSLFYDLGGKNYNYIPITVGHFKGLRTLLLVNNHLNLASFPDRIGDLPIQKLDLSWNPLEAVPECVARMNRLEDFSLSSNKRNIAFPDQCPLWQARNLRSLDLSSNQIESISSRIGNLTRMEILELGDNQLSDLPDSLLALAHLRELYLNGNRFQTFPKVLSQLPALQVLNLVGNRHFHFADISEFIWSLVNNGKERIEIHLDASYGRDARIQKLIQEVESGSGYLLKIQNQGGHTIISLRKNVEMSPTQVDIPTQEA